MTIQARRITIANALLVTLLALPCLGQVATGSYPYGTFDNKGFDTINLGNLNVHLSIPIINKPGRGLPFYYDLSYDSSVWYPASVGGSLVWTPAQNFGWKGDSEIAMGYVSYDQSTIIGRVRGTDGMYYTCPTTYYTNFVYHDTFGVQHTFPGSTTINTTAQPPQCNPLPSQPTYSGTATDGSGYTLNITNYTKANLTSPTGKQVNPASGGSGPTGAGSAIDSNGNEITADGSGHFTDTVGVPVLTVGGGAPNPETFTYTDSNGQQQTVKINYSQYTVQTNFGCSVSEYGPTATYLVSSIVFPDGSTYGFQYEPTPGAPDNVTGRIAGVTLPQGGTISYGYSNGGVTGQGGTTGSQGIMCADGSTSGLTRQIAASEGSAASTWSYSRATGSDTSTTQVTDGLSNISIYNFVVAGNQPAGTTAVYYETNRSIYQGAATGTSTPLLARQTCYNNQSPSCTTQSLTLPVTQIDTYQTLNGTEENGSTLSYDAYGDLSEDQDYDFGGSSSRGPLLRKEVWTYGGSIVGLVTEDQVYDTSGIASQTQYGYDGTTLTPTSGVPQHLSVSGPRGNLTGIDQYTASGTYLLTTAQYNDTGALLNATGPNGEATFGFDSTYTFMTQVTPPTPSSGVALPSSATYDANTGLQISSTDPNNKQQLYSYDYMMRPTQINNPDSGKTIITPDADSNVARTSYNLYQNSSTYTDIENLVDAYARQSTVAEGNGQSGQSWYQQDSCYDGNGNLSFQSYRYQGDGVGSTKVCSGSGDSYFYDALGRVTQIARGDGSGTSIYYSYDGRATQSTDENGVSRITQIDGLGRLTGVCEIFSPDSPVLYGNQGPSNIGMPSSGSPSSCGLDIAGTGYLTNYAYNLSNHETTVTQGSQTRVFQTDWLGRPTLIQEPESGQTSYSYTYNSTGLKVIRARPEANQANSSVTTTTTTQYDSVGRPVSVNYSDGTPTKTYAYDTNTSSQWTNFTPTNLKGRMYLAYNGTAPPATVYSYDAMGRMIELGECTSSGCGNGTNDKHLLYTYDWLGNTLTAADGAGVTTTYGYSPANEVTSITSSLNDSTHPSALVSNVQNGPVGPLSWQMGNGTAAVRTYDAVGRIGVTWICQGSAEPFCSGGEQLYESANAWTGSYLTLNCDTILYQCNEYDYDQMGRLVSSGDYGWVYDRWDNRWQQNSFYGGWSSQLTFNTANNQITTSGFGYDAAGNLLSDGVHTYTYDAEGNVTQVDPGGSTAKFVYDALNRRVQVDSGGDGSNYVFNPYGQRVSYWDVNSGQESQGQVYWGSSPVEYYSNGVAHFQHQDSLGTERMRTTYNGQVEGTFTSLPFGDGLTTTGSDTDAYHFAVLDHDYSSDTDHAQFRQYANASGRWMSPDPYSGSYDLTNPQSMNRYAYVLNNPLGFVDTFGLVLCFMEGADTWTISVDGVTSGGSDSGVYICTDDPGAGGGGGGYIGGGGGGGGGGGAGNNSIPQTPQTPCAVPSGNHLSVGASMSVATVNPLTSGGGGVWGGNQQSFGNAAPYNYSYSGAGLGLDVGASMQQVVAWGSGPWTGTFTSLSVSLGTFTGSVFWTPGKGGWTGASFGVAVGSPVGGAVEKTNYACKPGSGSVSGAG